MHDPASSSGQLDPNRSGWVSLEYQPVSHPWVQRNCHKEKSTSSPPIRPATQSGCWKTAMKLKNIGEDIETLRILGRA
jgi:hypothetical protein